MLDLILIALPLFRSTTPMVAVMLVVFPLAPTQCAAVSTICLVSSAPPQPIESRTMNGNSPCAARVPPTTLGVTSPAWAGSTMVPVASRAPAASVVHRVS
ncbi:hypothetical protein ASC99_31540 [Kitasatospora sp. Root107]|nr:hypothetical protein ASC99_31540 [Kitasatospora sp. Root107]